MNFLKNTPFRLLLVLLLLNLIACTNKKNTLTTRTYHNLTSRYNGLFNGNEAYKEGVKKLEASIKEDYDRILPVYNYGTANDAKNIFPEMEKCFKKASSVVERHSIRIKGREYCKWIDETFILIGKSHLYKHDYFPALEAFEYVIAQFKKEPTRYEAKLWKIRTLNEMGNVSESESMLDDIKGDKKFPKKQYAEAFAAAEADLYLRTRNNEPAISWLRKAIKESKSKKNKIRYSFILAQLYQEKGDNQKALGYYDQVLKLHPNYEMSFYARLNKARVMETNSKNAKSVKKELLAMSKDGKNEEYKDQIFYTLAQIEQKENHPDAAIEYLKKSITLAKKNQKQKGKSSLLLADIYYEKTEYVFAQAYYDSAVSNLNKDFPGYYIIENKRNNLSKLVAYIDTVNTQDSLLAFAKMDEGKRKNILEKEIKKKIEAYYVAKKAAKEAAENQSDENASSATTTNPFNEGTAWYFYNTTTLTYGMTDFVKKWGNRPLEDNWRRSSKQMNTTGPDTGNVAENIPSEEELDKIAIEKIKDEKQYLSKVPFNKEDQEKSSKSVANSLYNLGVIYTQQLDNKVKGAASFEALLERFPEHPDKLTVYYQLYRIFIQTGNKAKADYYKDLLIKDDPYSEFSQLITNPDFDVTTESSKSKAAKLYEDAFDAYKESEYRSVIIDCNTAHRLYKNSELMPKFDYLKAIAIGKTEGVDEMEKLLKEILLKYPSDPIREEAQNLLGLISKQKKSIVPSVTDTTVQKPVEVGFVHLPDTTHFYMVIYSTKNPANASISTKLNDFNTKMFNASGLQSTSIFFSEENYALIVKSFPNQNKALEYFKIIKDNDEVYKDVDKNLIEQFVIGQNNFQLLLKEKSTQKYQLFFKEKYLTSLQGPGK